MCCSRDCIVGRFEASSQLQAHGILLEVRTQVARVASRLKATFTLVSPSHPVPISPTAHLHTFLRFRAHRLLLDGLPATRRCCIVTVWGFMLEKEFQGWLDIGGARIYNIEPAIFPGDLRGVKAAKSIKPGASLKSHLLNLADTRLIIY